MIRALHEWILENDCTPYILVNAYEKGVSVPQDYVKDGQIVLNISPVAIQSLLISNDALEFNGRFGGVPTHVYVPISAVLGIYARENGQGMIFETDDPIPEPPKPDPDDPPAPRKEKPAEKADKGGKPGKPSLRVVK
jgi:stringent starvation protein B